MTAGEFALQRTSKYISEINTSVQVWFKNRRAKCRQIQKAGEQQQQVVTSAVKNSGCVATQLTNGNDAGHGRPHEPTSKQRSASACSSGDSRDSPPPIKFNCNSMPVTGTGNRCSRSPSSTAPNGAELDRASGDGSIPSVSPPGVIGSYCQLSGSPPSPGLVLSSSRPSCLATSGAMWPSPSAHDAFNCNGVAYRGQSGTVGQGRAGLGGYGSAAMMHGPSGNGFYGSQSLVAPSYGYSDVGGTPASYGYYGNGAAVEQWQWTTSMTRAYCAPHEHVSSGQMIGCGTPAGQGPRYGGMDFGSYLSQSQAGQLADLAVGDVEERKDWYRFHAL